MLYRITRGIHRGRNNELIISGCKSISRRDSIPKEPIFFTYTDNNNTLFNILLGRMDICNGSGCDYVGWYCYNHFC